jgi:hypothetical protein
MLISTASRTAAASHWRDSPALLRALGCPVRSVQRGGARSSSDFTNAYPPSRYAGSSSSQSSRNNRPPRSDRIGSADHSFRTGDGSRDTSAGASDTRGFGHGQKSDRRDGAEYTSRARTSSYGGERGSSFDDGSRERMRDNPGGGYGAERGGRQDEGAGRRSYDNARPRQNSRDGGEGFRGKTAAPMSRETAGSHQYESSSGRRGAGEGNYAPRPPRPTDQTRDGGQTGFRPWRERQGGQRGKPGEGSGPGEQMKKGGHAAKWQYPRGEADRYMAIRKFYYAGATITPPTEPMPERRTTPEQRTADWAPTKKLTFAAMAGLRALHDSNPKLYDRAMLSEKFGISYDAVGRILRSKFQQKQGAERKAGVLEEGHHDAEQLSPVPAIQRALAQKASARGPA